MKKRFIVFALIIAALAVLLSGCTGASKRYLGWSGAAFSGDSVYFGSTQGEVVSVELGTGNPNFKESVAGESGGGCAASTAASIYGTPVYEDGTLYVTAQLNPIAGKVYAYNADTGNLKWEYPAGDNVSAIVGGAAISEGILYFADTAGKVFAIDTGNGSELWAFETGDKIWATPAVNGDLIYVGSFDKKMYALNKKSGAKVWEFEAEGALVAKPLYHEGVIYIGSLDRNMYALNAQSGELKWKTAGQSWFWATPAVYGNTLYAPSIDESVYILNIATGEQIDRLEFDDQLASSPAVVDSLVVVATLNGKVHAINTENNSVRLITDLEVRTVAPIIALDGVVYIHTQEDETLYAINPETREILWSYSIQ